LVQGASREVFTSLAMVLRERALVTSCARWWRVLQLGMRLCSLVSIVLVLSSVSGCGGCDQKTVDKATAFLDAHQSCKTTDDCRVVNDNCKAIPGGFCGQLAMNREGAESSEWKSLQSDLKDCAPDSCETCAALMIPQCVDGVCSKR
jgi:hypothetical protein